jgi:anti-sigma regulatory factor (Ser/Thr protein kinase)
VTIITTIAAVGFVPPPLMPPDLRALDGNWPRQSGAELDAHPSAVPRARAYARQVLKEWDLPDVFDDLALILSELLTNAIQTMQATGCIKPIWLWLLESSAGVAMLVWDTSISTPRRGDASPDDESGRGMAIVDTLSTSWGWHIPALPHSGKVVWALYGITGTEQILESPMRHDALFTFERVNLEKLRLACQVILDQAEESFVSDSLEEELYGLRDQIERVLLMPDRPAAVT